MDDNSENQKQNIDIEHKIKLYLEQMSDDEKRTLNNQFRRIVEAKI